MPQLKSDLNIEQKNSLLPYFSSSTWNLTNADFLPGDEPVLSNNKLPTFNWIQAFFDSTLGVAPRLAVWSGRVDDDGLPVISNVRFAYSGDKVEIKGTAIMTSGTDRRGITVTSTPIGSTLNADLTEVIAFGGDN